MSRLIIFLTLVLVTRALAAPPQRVIALSPAITEIIYSLGAEKLLVGVSEFSDYPAAAKKLPSVGPYTKPILEKIISLKPDLVLLPQEGPQDVQTQFDRLKIKYQIVKMRTLDDIPRAADQIAKQLGSDKEGAAFVAKWKSDYQKIFQPGRFSKMPLYPKTLIEVQYEPLYAAASDTFLDQIVSLCGGVNIFGKQTGYPRLSREKVFANPPAIILAVDHIQSVKDKNEIIEGWRKFPMTAKAQIIFVNPDIASRPGPRLLEGAKEICDGINTNSLEHGR